ncbi:hypothetical protein JCGZ_10794 [Jatropha curcas]|uniref:Uncharacterized protein n=1 Tax=Jatropha curcas TaxID=180498 RepID=A0A067LQG8_JATCU|nr:hypothetical protein JCGZ_10794 [Jatropha curcas]
MEACPMRTPTKEDHLAETHQLLLEIKQAQLEAMTLFQVKIAPQREKAPQEISWLRVNNYLVRVEEPSIPSDLSNSIFANSLGSCIEIENSPTQADFSASTSTSVDNMGETSVPISEIEKLVQKIVAAGLEKLLRLDKDKKLEKLHILMRSKGMDQYMDIDEDEDEELELRNTIPLTYKMPKVSKYYGTDDPKVQVMHYKAMMELAGQSSKEILKMFPMSLTEFA